HCGDQLLDGRLEAAKLSNGLHAQLDLCTVADDVRHTLHQVRDLLEFLLRQPSCRIERVGEVQKLGDAIVLVDEGDEVVVPGVFAHVVRDVHVTDVRSTESYGHHEDGVVAVELPWIAGKELQRGQVGDGAAERVATENKPKRLVGNRLAL